jgi:probable F420-dependent oxidoreductase
MSQVHFGVTIPQIKRSWAEAKAASLEFEAMGFDSLWVCDHLYGPQAPSIPILEAWTLLAGVAAVTERVELGTLVTPAGMRNPAHLGKVIATVDNIAEGRVIAGLGGGWMEREFVDFGVPFLSIGKRLAQLDETIQLLRRMWGDEPEVTFEGKLVQANHLVCEPKPPRRVPILVGGSGEKTIGITAKHADIWNSAANGLPRLPESAARLRERAREAGRADDAVRISEQCLVTIAASDEEAEPMKASARKIFGGHMGDTSNPLAIAGGPETVRDRIQKHIDLGVTMFIIEFFGRDTKAPAQLFADTVVPHFR